MNTFSKIVDFLKNLLDLILGKSHGDPTVNPDGGSGAQTQESKVDTLHSKIDDGPSVAKPTDDGGINYDNFNKESKK